jgi:large subunit ribosomal protein L35
MPKMKTHRGAAKRFRVTRNGKILHRKTNDNHNFEKKTSRRRRRLERKGRITAERKDILRLLGKR